MRTVGIDLASQPRNTALCEIDWVSGAVVLRRGEGVNDEALAAAVHSDAEKVAIDAPFGWPEPFVAALTGAAPWPRGSRRALERRATDLWVWERIGKLPLSVSTDRIAYCAMRCAAILDGLGPRDGSGRVLEAYPDAALRCWVGGPWASYKGPARVRREVLLAPLLDVVALSAAQVEACVAWDDNLDALVCALVARAAALGETIPPPPELERLALVEGWIHLPRAGSLSRIGRAGAPGRSR